MIFFMISFTKHTKDVIKIDVFERKRSSHWIRISCNFLLTFHKPPLSRASTSVWLTSDSTLQACSIEQHCVLKTEFEFLAKRNFLNNLWMINPAKYCKLLISLSGICCCFISICKLLIFVPERWFKMSFATSCNNVLLIHASTNLLGSRLIVNNIQIYIFFN